MRVVRALLFVGLTLAVLEIGSAIAVESGLLPAARPARGGDGYWWGGHPSLGVWRHPDASFEHRSPCFHARYRSNSVGARDLERSRAAEGPRVVVLGDSFLEGWGLPDNERLSNRLEAATGIPHLNFAMAHFSPYQALLAYQELASQFEHSGVLLGVLPVNDFVDGDLALARRLPDYEYRYRPYLWGEPPHFARLDYREPALRQLLRRHSYAANALLLGARLADARFGEPAGPAPSDADRGAASWFYDFSEADLARLEAVLEQLADAAQGRPVAVLLIPSLADLRRFASAGPAPLAGRLAASARRGIEVVDLLPALAAEARPWNRLYFACDYHWNDLGNRSALGPVLAALERDFYPRVRDDASRR